MGSKLSLFVICGGAIAAMHYREIWQARYRMLDGVKRCVKGIAKYTIENTRPLPRDNVVPMQKQAKR